jgi:D-alanyl-lipoteichoic acid acyltransferase DltB (MBOAT superfamily)
LLVFFLIGSRQHHRISIAWLVAASLFFYAWWNPAYLGLILFSIFFNYGVGVALSSRKKSRILLAAGIVVNLSLLAYYKYAHFLLDNVNQAFGSSYTFGEIILPLAISFFTFQQIAYVVDAYQGKTREYNFLHYILFVSFFPQLIAGPIVHHKEMLPQFARNATYRFNLENFNIGLSIFVIGLFKKVVLADGVAQYSTPVFNSADAGQTISFFEAWGGTLGYSFQLYFDFSGYSDMAIGLARMFGIKLPLNFNSPYKSANITQFWRTWHMTLSRFLRDYLYIPLGGNRKGRVRRHINLFLTMLLGGLWHGAAWNFVIWGALHGIYLIINHSWHAFRQGVLGQELNNPSTLGRAFGVIITFTFVSLAWVFFRAETLAGAFRMAQGLIGANGFVIPEKLLTLLPGYLHQLFIPSGGALVGAFNIVPGFAMIVFLAFIAFFAPNAQQLMGKFEPAYGYSVNSESRLSWQPSFSWALFISLLLFISLKILVYTPDSEFLYFNF